MLPYGPPADPREVPIAAGFADLPLAYLACVVVGGLLFGYFWRRSRLIGAAGLAVLLTVPFTALIPSAVYGAFPTVDKYGSLAFYLDGVHWRLLDVHDPALQLIGVHMGHNLVTALLDLGAEAFAAVNAHAWLNLVLNLSCSLLLFESLGAPRLAAYACAIAFGFNLHIFRDLNWYTIEKSGVWWLPLYAWALLGASRGERRAAALAPLIYVGASFYNLYWGVLGAGIAAMALLGSARTELRAAVAASALAGSPLFFWQWRLMQGAAAPGDPERFVNERAALDVVSLWPPRWNRLELWRTLDPVVLGLGVRGMNRWIFLGILPFFVLALGPSQNPPYQALLELAPGFWRLAKPECLFEVVWLGLTASAARESGRHAENHRLPWVMFSASVVFWLLAVRSHPVYPAFSAPLPVTLPAGWSAG